MSPVRPLLTTLLWLLLAFPLMAWSQIPGEGQADASEAEATEPEVLYDPLGRTSPEGLVLGYLSTIADRDYARAARYFNLADIPRSRRTARGQELALALQQLLDQGGMLAPRWQLSNNPTGQLNDGLAPNQERVGNLPSPEGNLPIIAERVEDTESGLVWVFSAETSANLPDLAEALDESLLNRMLPNGLITTEWGGVPVGHWLAMLLVALLAVSLAWTLTRIVLFVVMKVARGRVRDRVDQFLTAASPPLTLFLAVTLFYFINVMIGVSIIARQFFSHVSDIVAIVALVWLLWRMIDMVGETTVERVNRRGRPGALAAISLFRRFGKAALLAIAFMVMLDSFGVNVTAGLTALGIGGLAIALGAQKTVENFVGSLTLIADQPIRVGDFCRFGDTLGTVEDIGMRSTRVRTLDRTVITVPNGEFSSMRIENFSRRDNFWFHPVLALRYETTPDQIRYLLVELRAMMYAHPAVLPDPARVKFVGLGADSLTLEFFAYIRAKDVSEFMDIQEDLLLRIMDIVTQSGASFAFPSQTIYFAQDAAVDQAKKDAAEQQVKQWQEAGELQLPQFDPQRIAELRNSLEYPPPGSVLRKK